MKFKQLLTKTLLVAVGLLAGQSAWADLTKGTTTTVNFDNQKTPFVIHDGNRLGASYVLHEGSETDYYAKYYCGNKNALPFAAYDISSAVSKAVKVEVSFDCFFPNDNGIAYIAIADKDIHNATNGGYDVTSKTSVYGKNGTIWALGRYRGKPSGSNTTSNYHKVNDTDKNSKLPIATWYTVNVTVDLTTQKVSYTIKEKGGNETLDSGTNMNYWDTEEGTTATACNQIDISMPHTGNVYIDNISITPYTDESEKYAGYTIKYMCGETELKSAVTDRDEVKVGEYATLLPADKEAIWVEEQKYIYVSDDAGSQTIEEGGNTVITVNFRKAGTYSYTLNAVDSENTLLKTFGTADDAVEGEIYYVRGAKAFYKDDVLYSTEQVGGFEEKFTEAATKTITYNANTDWTYFAEAEDMTIVGSWNGTGAYPGFYSNGVAKTLATSSYVYTDVLAGGVYKVTAWARNNDKNNQYSLQLYVRDSEGNLKNTSKTMSWNAGDRIEKSVTCVVIPDGYSLVFKNDGGGNSKLEFDYVYVEKTNDAIASLDVASAIYDCNTYETSDAFNNYIVDLLEKGDLTTQENVYVAHTAWQIENGNASKAILNNTVTSADHFWGTLKEDGANYDGAPDTKYLSWDKEYSVNQIVYGLPAGVYEVSAWTYASEEVYQKLYISKVVGNDWTDLAQPETNASGWKKLSATITLTEDANIAFGFYAGAIDGGTTGFDNWTLTKINSVDKTISNAGWSTYCSPYILDFSNTNTIGNLEAAYIVTGGENGVLKTTKVEGAVPANTGLLLKGTANASVNIPVAATATVDVAGNKLVGVTASETLPAGNGYVLMTTPSLAFYKNKKAFTLSANSAYLPVDFDENSGSGEARASFLLFGDDVTGISQVAGSEVKTSGAVYNLNGQRVSQPVKGLYIIDGKKVVIK